MVRRLRARSSKAPHAAGCYGAMQIMRLAIPCAVIRVLILYRRRPKGYTLVEMEIRKKRVEKLKWYKKKEDQAIGE